MSSPSRRRALPSCRRTANALASWPPPTFPPMWCSHGTCRPTLRFYANCPCVGIRGLSHASEVRPRLAKIRSRSRLAPGPHSLGDSCAAAGARTSAGPRGPVPTRTPAGSRTAAVLQSPAQTRTPAGSSTPARTRTPASTPAGSQTAEALRSPAQTRIPAVLGAPAGSRTAARTRAPAVLGTPARTQAPAVLCIPAGSQTPATLCTAVRTPMGALCAAENCRSGEHCRAVERRRNPGMRSGWAMGAGTRAWPTA